MACMTEMHRDVGQAHVHDVHDMHMGLAQNGAGQ